MKYRTARSLICTGDLVAFRQKTGVFHALVRWVTQSPYTHTAIAVWAGGSGDPVRDPLCARLHPGRLLVVEETGFGAVLTPLSQYAGIDFDVMSYPGEVRGKVEKTMWRLIGQPIGFDWLDLLRVAANRLFGRPLPVADDERRICSALSAEIWLQAGWKPRTRLPSIPAPCDIVAVIGGDPILKVRA